MKLMFMATHPLQTNGYARIGYRLVNYLANYYDVIYYGFSNYDLDVVKRPIHKNIQIIDALRENSTQDPFGYEIFKDQVRKHSPDIIIIYNDLLVTCNFLNRINELRSSGEFTGKVVNYIDLVYDFEDPEYINFCAKWCDMLLVFSEHWKQNLLDMNVNTRIEILPHGFDEEQFFEVEKFAAREAFGGLNQEDFIILNNNRNSYRKAHDIIIAAFLQFLKRVDFDPTVKLFIHCDIANDYGYDIRKIVALECVKQKVNTDLIMNNHILITPKNRMNDEQMNFLYNSCDVGVNSCVGEGFGLCNLEHMALGKPQIVSRVGGLKDIFIHYPEFTVEPVAELTISRHIDAHIGVIKICRSQDFTDKLYKIYTNRNLYNNWAQNCRQYVRGFYDWSKINSHLVKVLKSL